MDTKLLREARNTAKTLTQRVHLQIPSILGRDEEFSLKISVRGCDGLPIYDFSEPIVFSNSSGLEGLPEKVMLPPGESTVSVEGLKAVGPNMLVIRGEIETPPTVPKKACVVSNPAWVFADPTYRIYWGDIHVHTRYSNCNAWRCLDPEWCYYYAREISLLDFAAPADHLRGIAAESGRWPRLQQLAQEFNSPGEFVTFLAYESSHASGYGGDNNVYFLDDDAPYFWLDGKGLEGTKPAVPLEELWKQMDASGKRYFTVPHHNGRAGKYRTWNEAYYDPDREPLFEIYSSWGSSEMRHSRLPIAGGNNDDESYFVDALKAGARFGVIASSDDHATLPGSVHHHRTEPYCLPNMNGHRHKGLAAVRCPELTRPALFDAMQRRNCYATTHMRSLVDLYIGDASMGEEVIADAALKSKREIVVRLTLHEAGKGKVTIMRNGEPFASENMGGAEVTDGVKEMHFTDDNDLEKVAISDAFYHPEPFVVYYARVEDANTAHQWTSPIWIDLV